MRPGGADREVRQHVRVVAGEVHQVGLVEHAADFAEVALRVLDRQHVGVLGDPEDRLVADRHTGAAGDVVEDHRQVGGVGDEPEVGEDAGLRGLVVVRRDDHDAVGADLLARLVELDRVRGLVRAAARDDLRAAGGDILADLDQADLLGIRQRARLTGGAGHDDAVGSGGDDVVHVLLDGGPIDLAVGRHRSDERDEHLTEGIAGVRHVLRLSARRGRVTRGAGAAAVCRKPGPSRDSPGSGIRHRRVDVTDRAFGHLARDGCAGHQVRPA